jgi:hypothetical protein
MATRQMTRESVPHINHLGLGLAPSDYKQGLAGLAADPSPVLNCGWTQMAVLEYIKWSMELPLLDEDLENTFGDRIELMANDPDGIMSVDSSFPGTSNTLQVDLLLIGWGIHCWAEPITLSAIGNAIPVASTGPIWSLDAFTTNDLVNGNMGPTSGIAPAVLEWGYAAQMAAWKLAHAYNAIFRIQQRVLLVDEPLSDSAFFGTYGEAVAAGDAQVAIQRYALAANKQYRELGSPTIFQPPIARRVGDVSNPVPPASGVQVSDSHVTSDFALADVRYGGIRNQGGAFNGQPFRRMNRPALLCAGIPIWIYLEERDQHQANEMRRYLSISESLGGTTAVVPFDSVVNGLTPTAAGNVGIEQNLDSTPINVPQQANTNRTYFKGGQFQLEVVLKGFETTGPWVQFIQQHWGQWVNCPSQGAMAAGTAGLPRMR